MEKELSEMSLKELWQLFPIRLTEHNELWKAWYEEERDILEKLLVDQAITRISHIGSTAIEGIWAKPIVDVLIEVENESEFCPVMDVLLDNEYLCMSKSDTRMVFNKGYTKNGFAKRVFHIHIRLAGDHDELYFRDYLNAHSEIAKEYEVLKLSLWKQFEHDRDAYTAAKTDFVDHYTAEAKELYVNRAKQL